MVVVGGECQVVSGKVISISAWQPQEYLPGLNLLTATALVQNDLARQKMNALITTSHKAMPILG